jgi:hypothetical protein
MAYKTSLNSGIGLQGFLAAQVDTVQRVALGTTIKGFDDVLGEGEFIYLPGAANVVAGDAVVYDLAPGAVAVTRMVNNAFNNSGRPVAIAVAAVPAGSFGWYQIGGCAIANTIGGTVAGVAMANATTGQLSNTADAGDQIIGARISTAVGTPAAGQSYVTLNRPCMQSQIT